MPLPLLWAHSHVPNCFVRILLNISKYTTLKPINRVVLSYTNLATILTLFLMYVSNFFLLFQWPHNATLELSMSSIVYVHTHHFYSEIVTFNNFNQCSSVTSEDCGTEEKHLENCQQVRILLYWKHFIHLTIDSSIVFLSQSLYLVDTMPTQMS